MEQSIRSSARITLIVLRNKRKFIEIKAYGIKVDGPKDRERVHV